MTASTVQLVATWPPGSLMLFDNCALEDRKPANVARYHRAVGLVVANDGRGTIRVLWDSGCQRRCVEYDVAALNPKVVSRLG